MEAWKALEAHHLLASEGGSGTSTPRSWASSCKICTRRLPEVGGEAEWGLSAPTQPAWSCTTVGAVCSSRSSQYQPPTSIRRLARTSASLCTVIASH
jgi:hypothetical protein